MKNGEVTLIASNETKTRSITGVMMNYLHICDTELWYFAHDINMSYDSDIVALGRLVNEEYYIRDAKEIPIFENVRIDRITPDGYVHEVKKSDRAEEAHLWQLKYYLWMLKRHGFGDIKGVLEFPKQRKRVPVQITPDDEKQIEEKLRQIRQIIDQPRPPKPKKIPYCRKCSYRELCWC